MGDYHGVRRDVACSDSTAFGRGAGSPLPWGGLLNWLTGMKLFTARIGTIVTGVLVLGSTAFSAARDAPQMPLTLEDAIQRALLANRTIEEALDDVARTSHSLAAARSDFQLQILPGAFVSDLRGGRGYGAGLAFSQRTPIGTQITAAPRFTTDGAVFGTSLDLSLTQSLTKGLSPSYTLASVRRSEFESRQALRQLSLTKNQIVLQTISEMYEIVRRGETVRLQQASYVRLKSYYETALLKQKIGLASGLDVYRASISLKQAESLLLASRESYQDGVARLSLLLCVPLDNSIEVQAPLDVPPFLVEEVEAIATAMDHRLELRQLQDAVSMAESEASVAKRNLLPDLDLFARYSFTGAESSPGKSLSSLRGTFGVGLTASGNVRRPMEHAAYETSHLAIRSAGRLLDLRRDEIVLEINYALRNKRRAETAIALQTDQLWQVTGKLELAKVKFTHGMASNFDVIESESELRQAEIDLVSARIDAIIAQYALKAAMGVLLDDQDRLAR